MSKAQDACAATDIRRDAATSHRKKHPYLKVLTDWLDERHRECNGALFLLTLRFDQHRDRYCIIGGDDDAHTSPSRAEVASGLTLPMPLGETKTRLWRDLDRFYCMLLRLLLGGRYAKRRAIQPIAVGALDGAVFKNVAKRSAPARKSTNVFDHAHFVILIPGILYRQRSLLALFERYGADGTLTKLWRKLNGEGEVHLVRVDSDLGKVVDYDLKTAQRMPVFEDELRFWPAVN